MTIVRVDFFKLRILPMGLAKKLPQMINDPNVWISSITQWVQPFPLERIDSKSTTYASNHVPDLIGRVSLVKSKENTTAMFFTVCSSEMHYLQSID